VSGVLHFCIAAEKNPGHDGPRFSLATGGTSALNGNLYIVTPIDACQTADHRVAGSSARPVSASARWTRDIAPATIRGHHEAALRDWESTPMPKVEAKRTRATMTKTDFEPHWLVDVDYGAFEVSIPLPARYLATDDFQTQRRQSVEAMESLAEALLRFADQTRKQWPHDWEQTRE
jgi:hypothetical protein